jgi:P-type Mg2+ transporter
MNNSEKGIVQEKNLQVTYSRLNVEDSLKKLAASAKGLTEEEAKERISIYGHNEPAKRKKFKVVRQLVSKFLNPLIIILLITGLLALFFGEKISALFIFLMILVSMVLSFIQEHGSEKAIEKLRELVKTKVLVLRNGKQEEIDITELVPGDIVELYVGDIIPADLRIISAKHLFINQSTLTGESLPVEKISEIVNVKGDSINELKNIAFMGSSVSSGSCFGLVIATGLSTQFGEISKVLAKEKVETNFDTGVRNFTLMMIKFTVFLVIGIFVINYLVKKGSFKEALLFSLAVAVGLTPEMLPMIVTINLAKGARAMAKEKVIVKHLDSIQNFGAMDVLCTDKTGTLTENNIVLQKHCDINGRNSEEVFRYAYINSHYQTGIKHMIEKAVINHEKISIEAYKKISEIPFDYSRRMISVVVTSGVKKENLLVAKGSPDEILKRCNVYEVSGRTHKLSKGIFLKLKKEYEKLSNQGFIVIAVAYKKFDPKKSAYSSDDEKNLVLCGYLAFLDPPKKTTKEVIGALKGLGIEMKVLTGDNDMITKKICEEVGFEIKGLLVGTDIDSLNDQDLREAVEKNNVFARLNPSQKEKVISALRLNNHVVGFLGDGINDAPSLRVADVGISVNNAVDIAKESADIILLEKSLMVLKDGVIEGRKTFGNIIKYVKMGSSSNFGNMLSMTGATLFLPFLPMLPIQILFNNFLYDMAQIPLPNDKVDKEYLLNPRSWNIKFIEKFMLFIGPISSLFDFLTFGLMFFFFGATTLATSAIFHTGWFIESLCTQTLVIYVIRTNKIPFVESRPNKTLVLTTLAIILLAIGITLTSVGKYLGFTPLPPLYFLVLFCMIVIYLILVQIVKSFVVKKYGYQ